MLHHNDNKMTQSEIKDFKRRHSADIVTAIIIWAVATLVLLAFYAAYAAGLWAWVIPVAMVSGLIFWAARLT